jgi:hypothetical protein
MAKRLLIQEQDRALGEIAETSMQLARETAARLDKAKTLDEIEACVAEFERLTIEVCASISLRHELQSGLRRKLTENLDEELAGPRVLN